MLHSGNRVTSATGAVLFAAVLSVATAPVLSTLGPAAHRAEVALTSDSSGLDVGDLDSFLNDIGLGDVITDNDFLLGTTDPTESLGQWFFATSSVELMNLLSGVDASTLSTVLVTELLVPVIGDLRDMVTAPGDVGADVSQLLADLGQGTDQVLAAAAELLLLA